MNDPTDINAQLREQERLAEQQALAVLGDRADIMWLMGDRRGRNIVRRLLDWTGVMSASFTMDARLTDHNEGRRFVGIKLLNELQQHTPGEYLLMLAESLKLEKEQ